MNAFLAELGHAAQVIAQGTAPNALSCDLARDAIELCDRQTGNLRADG
jgi:hypothetical protein